MTYTMQPDKLNWRRINKGWETNCGLYRCEKDWRSGLWLTFTRSDVDLEWTRKGKGQGWSALWVAQGEALKS